MKFSFIIPIYNVDIYIRQCIDSILKQSYTNFEVILVNDGSKDRSPLICDEYSKTDRRVKVIHQKNSGVSQARNTGLNAIDGDYVLFIDGDDYLGMDFLNELVETIYNNNRPDLIFSNSYNMEMPKGKLIRVSNNMQERIFNSTFGEGTLEYLFNRPNFPWSVWGKIYKVDLIKMNNLYFEQGITLGEDADWLFRFILSSRNNLLTDIPFYNYRINRVGSAMNLQSYKNLSTYLIIVNKWITYAKKFSNNKLVNLLQTKLSNNYMGYFKYIYSLDLKDRNELIAEIKSVGILKYITDSKLNSMIEKKGFNKVLKYLNRKYKQREYIKRIVVKLGLLDR